MKTNLAESMSSKLAEVMQQYQKSQTDYKEKVKQKMVQKVRIVRPDATQTEIDNAIESGEVDKLYAKAAMDQSHLHGQAKNALAYVQDRHKDIVQLEASIQDMNQLFLDMAIMVESQGAILNIVEENTSSASADTKAAASLMGRSVTEQKKSRKKMYIIMAILLILIVVICAGTIGGTLGRVRKTDN